jgi:NAD(P)-dependent dehydrogenase (short-subunit alcohol dehydrogenase family)
MTDLSGRIALVTGASRGIGKAVAKAYARAGAHVLVTGRSEKDLAALAQEIEKSGGMCTIYPCDMGDMNAVMCTCGEIIKAHDTLDILVGNAAMLGTLCPLTQIDTAEWDQAFALNVSANFRLLHALHPLIEASISGRVIFVTTGASVVAGRPEWGLYGATKAALESMIRAYAGETSNTKIRVNLVDPGGVRTDMRAKAKPGEDPQTLPAPDDITGIFLDLASPEMTKTGQTFQVYT